ncbi:hypothetical protein [Acinetobacter pittii]|uniref:hypothetical protein n=1 Tax=Acinetobacter pittii TaxID=48296 RepID=UPI00208F4D12|nr:hypothetical protein [Acinetobacter pittii]
MDRMNLLAPLELSHTATELERALQQNFIKTYIELLGDDLKDLLDYGAPVFAGPNVIERFTKKDGLVVLRRPGVSEKLMRVIYSTWVSMGSKRGLAFLEFVLRMLWPNKYQIKWLYHSKALAQQYPARLTYQQNSENFLTSRIHVTMDKDVDLQELAELAPTLTKLVPANIVPSVAIEIGANDIEINCAVGARPLMIGNFEPNNW